MLRNRPQRTGIVYKVLSVKPKKPNSANRKIVKVHLLFCKRRIACYIPGIGHTLREFSRVLIRGGGVPDLPSVRYHLIRGCYDFNALEKFKRKHSRSKYGIPRVLHGI